MEAVIVKTTGKIYSVRTLEGRFLSCILKGKFRTKDIKSTNPIVVGDKVFLELDGDNWMIVDLLKRKNQIIRKSVNLSKQTHIIAANIDQAILMITLVNPITTTAFIDRFLVSANAYGVDVILLFNKKDIYNNELLEDQKYLIEGYRKIGYDVISLSVLNDNLSELKDLMKDKVNIISGHSGVGKSTLVNKLQPGLNIETKAISSNHQQGQHTTTFSQLYSLDFGGDIIDTPGIKGFGLVNINKNELANYMPEFFLFKNKCKFNNCIHHNEPDCYIKYKLEEGDILQHRYINYLNMLNEDDSVYRNKVL